VSFLTHRPVPPRSIGSRARDVAARTIKTGDEAEPDWVAAHFEDDRTGRSRRLCRKCRRSAGRGNHRNLTANEIGVPCLALLPTASPLFGDERTDLAQTRPKVRPAVRRRRVFVALAVSGLGSMYPASDWSVLRFGPRPDHPINGHGRTGQFWFCCSPSNQEKCQLC